MKVNAPDLLKKELMGKMKRAGKKDVGSMWFSSVTDPYQGMEAKYQLTRKCLQVLVDMKYEGRISILTKSPLVTRDIDLYQQLKNTEVGITVTSLGDPITRYLETNAPPHQERIKALEQMQRPGLPPMLLLVPYCLIMYGGKKR